MLPGSDILPRKSCVFVRHFVFILTLFWVFLGWPQIRFDFLTTSFNFPPEVKEAQADTISRGPDSFSENSSQTIGATALDTENYGTHPGASQTYVPANEFYADHPTFNGGGPQYLIIVWDETGINNATISSATLDVSGYVDGGFNYDTTAGGFYSNITGNPSFEYSTDGGSTWTAHSAGLAAITASAGDAAYDQVNINVATDIQAIADASQTSIQFRLGFDRGHGATGGPPTRAISIDHAFLDVTYTAASSCDTTPTVYSTSVSTTYSVPALCDRLTVKAWGAGGAGGGADAGNGGAGGGGEYATSVLTVTPGESLDIVIGGGGAGGVKSGSGNGGAGGGGGATTAGGGAGAGASATMGGGGGGGGYSAIKRVSEFLTQAGGGGGGAGGGNAGGEIGGVGGAGGGTSGIGGGNGSATGGGGGQSGTGGSGGGPGTGGSGTSGTANQGGNGGNNGGGGGGGGKYGGGGGGGDDDGGAGGGGGSGLGDTLTAGSGVNPGNNNVGDDWADNAGQGGAAGAATDGVGGNGNPGRIVIIPSATADTTPDTFNFTDQTDVALSTQTDSDIVQVTGMDNGTAISIDGVGSSQYRICADSGCGTVPHTWANTARSIDAGEWVQLRLTSSGSYSTATVATLTVGTLDVDWSVTTKPPNSAPATPTLSETPAFSNIDTSDTTPVLGNFSATDPESDAIEYEIQWDEDYSFGTPVTQNSSGFASNGFTAATFASGASVSYTVQGGEALTNGQTYWWRVRARDPSGANTWSSYSAPRSITINTSITLDQGFQTTTEQFESTNGNTLTETQATGNGVKLLGW